MSREREREREMESPLTAIVPFLHMYLSSRFGSSFVPIPYAVSLHPNGAPLGSPHSSSQRFSPACFFYALPGWFSFLSVTGTNVIKLERLHRAVSRAITSWLWFSPISLLSKACLLSLLVILTHITLSCYKRVLCLPTSFPISDLAKLRVKPPLCRSS